MDNFPQQPNTNSPFPPTPRPTTPGGGLTPPPPQTQDVRFRTMQSDIGSVQQTGGAEPISLPQTTDSAHELPPLEGGGGVRRAFMWLIGLIVILGLAWVAYAYVWPLTTGAPAVEQPASEEIVTETLPLTTEPVAPPPSPFGTPAENLATVTLTDNTIVSILAALQNQEKPADGNFKEFRIVDAGGKSISFSTYLGTLLPESSQNGLSETLASVFEDSFGAYIFYDDKGAWPGYVVPLRANSGLDIVTLTDRLQKIEASAYTNFFITPPGTAQAFRTGQIQGKYVDRFVPLSQPGASFNYGLFDRYLIINTSYGGLLKALELLNL